jgi:hypothetical protein
MGHVEFRKQVELKDTYRQPITVGTLASRIGKRVDEFLEVLFAFYYYWCMNLANTILQEAHQHYDGNDNHWQHDRLQEWLVDSHWRNSIYIVGLLHVSRGVWQPILQLRGRYPH